MGTEARSTFSNYIHRLLFAVAVKRFRSEPQAWRQWMTMRTSKDEYEESGYISGFGYLAGKGESQGYTYDSRIQGPVKQWVHDAFGLAVRISQENMEDLKHGIIKQVGEQLSNSAIATMHLLATRMLMTGTATTYHTDGFGAALFSQSHTRLDGGTWSNLGSAATPTETSLTSAIQNYENIKNDRGIAYENQAIGIICGKSLEFTFDKLLGSPNEPGTANNAVNAVRRLRNLKLTVDPRITDARWIVHGKKDPDVGFIHFDRIKPTVSKHGDWQSGDAIVQIRTRFSNECNDPRSMYMVPAA